MGINVYKALLSATAVLTGSLGFPFPFYLWVHQQASLALVAEPSMFYRWDELWLARDIEMLFIPVSTLGLSQVPKGACLEAGMGLELLCPLPQAVSVLGQQWREKQLGLQEMFTLQTRGQFAIPI